MLNWIEQHQGLLSVAINGGMLGIWILYAQLLLRDYRRKLRATVLINQGMGTALQSHCMVCNMSEQALYISLIIAELETHNDTLRCSITDLEDGSSESPASTVQGPLKAGEYRDLGDFETIVNRVLHKHKKAAITGKNREGAFHSLCIHVVGLYGSENTPIGASRRFCADTRHENISLTPISIDTQRLTGRRQQRQIRRWQQEYL